MKNLMHVLVVAATACLIGTTSCERKATEDELNEFRTLAEANDDSLQNELNALQDSIRNAQTNQFISGTLTGTFADSDTPFSVDFDFRNALPFYFQDVFFDEGRRILRLQTGVTKTSAQGGDQMAFSFMIDMDANTIYDENETSINGTFSENISANETFVYSFNYPANNRSVREESDVTLNNISYDAETELLFFSYSLSFDNNNSIGQSNGKAATIVGQASVIVPRETYETYPNPQYRK